MSTELANDEAVTDESAPVSTAELLTGILDDLRLLVEKQFQLMQTQVEVAVRRRLAGAMLVGMGCGVLLMAGTIGSFGLAHWLHWSLAPSSPGGSSFPLWACEGLVAFGLILFAALCIQIGRSRVTGSPEMNPRDLERMS